MTTRPTLLSTDPAKPYNVAVPAAEKKGGAPTYPLRNLLGAWRALTIVPWLEESSLEQVVEAWQAVRREKEDRDGR